MIKRTTNKGCKFVAPLLLLAPIAGFAQVDTSEWACESCPFDQGYRAEVAVGATSVSDDAARFGNYTGYDEKGVYANVDGQGRYNRNGYRLDWYIEDLGLDSRVFEITSGKQGVSLSTANTMRSPGTVAWDRGGKCSGLSRASRTAADTSSLPSFGGA